MPAPGEKKKGTEEVRSNAPATIQVNLPADAKLSVDGYQTTSTSSNRTFVSPELAAGMDYTYTLTAEIIRNGKPVVTSKRITVRAGEETRVSLDFSAASVAAE